ncbi:hypothetical protein EV193_104346 [Herbihabitans rhizosphaerae]|uniref:Uncharacterized protein n=1 Tax=Herbihabitans rhizosphaerae TaxID=1872711 RepID=A0A4Q7KSM7_9PSEU|nr:hypothetical protein EV193_104346 [Herbihabitans rhizosphaerae]
MVDLFVRDLRDSGAQWDYHVISSGHTLRGAVDQWAWVDANDRVPGQWPWRGLPLAPWDAELHSPPLDLLDYAPEWFVGYEPEEG